MVKEEKEAVQAQKKTDKQNRKIKANKSKYNRFDDIEQSKIDANKKNTWPTDGVVYLGHLPHGFYENQLKSYFTQYGQVLGVKVARSRKTARSKGYGFVQFKYPQVASIVAQTMNGYMIMGKILVANTLSANQKNPFSYATSKQYKFINWKRIFMHQKNRAKSPAEIKKEVEGLLKKEQEKRQKLKSLGIKYSYPGFSGCLSQK